MIIIIWLSKLLIYLLRLLKIGGGTSFPGLIVEKYFPAIVRKLSNKYEKVILVTGTNGKTTTQRLIRHILYYSQKDSVSNSSGANLFRSIATTIIGDTNWKGDVKSKILVLEVEEATMPILTKYLNASVIVVTNLYRDQLDAYGELFKTRKYILKAIENSPDSTLILNGDDPNVSSLANNVKNKTLVFAINDERIKDILYEKKDFELTRKENIKKIKGKNIKINKDLSSNFNYKEKGYEIKDIHFKAPGFHYIYNALSSIAAAREVSELKNNKIVAALSTFQPAFGRGETIQINEKKIKLLLIKNPASFTANLSMLKNITNLKLMIIINDNIPDGKDVSWLWDAKMESLSEKNISWITVSGKRALDMRLRLKYAELNNLGIEVEESISKALDISLGKLNKSETLFILPTYTAMLDVRKQIGKIVNITKFWE